MSPPAGAASLAGEELVDVVDEINRVRGQVPRSLMRARNLLHRGVAILCLNSRGQIHVHRRTETKDLFPGMYDMFVGGVVLSGEDYAAAARREIEEELGIRGVEPEFLFAHLYLGDRNRSWCYAYRAVWEGPVRLQPEEIVWGEWVDEAELEVMLREKPFVPDGLDVYLHYLEVRHLLGRPARGGGMSPRTPLAPCLLI